MSISGNDYIHRETILDHYRNPRNKGRNVRESYTRIKTEKDRLIHEHDFITKKLKGRNYSVIYCVACNDCYCSICGKLIEYALFTIKNAIAETTR